MLKRQGINKFILVLILISSLFIGACGTAIQTQESQQNKTVEVCGDNVCGANETYSSCPQDCKRPALNDLVIKLEDLPQGWEVEERGIRTKTDVDASSLAAGWEGGYFVNFKKTDSPSIKIENWISIYPKDKIKSILASYAGNTNDFDAYGNAWAREEIDNPKIGDDSRAFRETSTSGNTESVKYWISFNKADVHVNIDGPDYEQVLDLAKKLNDRI